MKNIKIYATQSQSCSKNDFIKNEMIVPVLGGAACKENIGRIQRDDEGENISKYNDSYCELTTQYWAWKNVKADYYGFCHYRRFFSFHPGKLKCDDWKLVHFKYANEKTKKELCLDHMERIHHVVEGCDILLPSRVDLRKVGFGSVYEQFKKIPHLRIEALDLAIAVIQKKYPKYNKAAKKYLYGPYFYPYNMFIMSGKIFRNYSAWLFDILSQVDAKLNMDPYSIQGRRIIGHIGERLLGVYITYLEEKFPALKIRELQVGFIQNADITYRDKLQPAFSKKNIPVVMAANEFFVPMMAAAINSMICSSSDDWNYDVVILESGISEKIKRRLHSMVEAKQNFSLRYYNAGPLMDGYDLFTSHLITVETYYRFLIPELFEKFHKVLYLDGDMIIKRDIKDLFQTDIGNNLIGACHDVTIAGSVNGAEEEHYVYCQNKLKLKDPVQQFNAGVMVMNLDAFRASFTTAYMLDFAEKGKFKYWDQDALNILCEGRVYWLDSAWNYFADEKDRWRGRINQFAPRNLYRQYEQAAKQPYIYHFAGNEKPWFDPNYEYAEQFWTYLRNTPFYETMLQRRMTDTSCYFIGQYKQDMQYESLRHFARRVLAALFPSKTFRGKAARKGYLKIRKILTDTKR